MANSVGGTTTNDSSAADWEGATLGAAESYADSVADAESQARSDADRAAAQAAASGGDGADPAPRDDGHGGGTTDTNNGSGAAPGTGNGTSGGRTEGPLYLQPAEAQQLRDAGFDVKTDPQGRPYLQGDQDVRITQPAPPRDASAPNGSGSRDTVGGPDTNPPAQDPGPSETPETTSAPESAPDVDPPDKTKPFDSKMGPEVDALLAASPTLRAKWHEALEKGWTIKFSDKVVSNANSGNKTITINLGMINPDNVKSPLDLAEKKAALLAHEIGHAVSPERPRIEAGTREDFVQKNTAQSMAAEGDAAFESTRARDEIRTSTGHDIGIRGGSDVDYMRVYNDFKSGKITEAQARTQMADLMAKEPQSGTPGNYVTKEELARKEFEDAWDEKHP
jgi:hypothetical protein